MTIHPLPDGRFRLGGFPDGLTRDVSNWEEIAALFAQPELCGFNPLALKAFVERETLRLLRERFGVVQVTEGEPRRGVTVEVNLDPQDLWLPEDAFSSRFLEPAAAVISNGLGASYSSVHHVEVIGLSRENADGHHLLTLRAMYG